MDDSGVPIYIGKWMIMDDLFLMVNGTDEILISDTVENSLW